MANYDAYTTVNANNILNLGLQTGAGVGVADAGSSGSENLGVLGDVAGDTFTANTGLFGAPVTYTYAGTVFDGDGNPVGFVGTSLPLGGVGGLTSTTFVPEGTDVSNLQLSLLSTDTVTPETQWDLDEAAPVCFMAGTAITTLNGAVAVESLLPGDEVLTADGRQVPVRWIGRRMVSRQFADPQRFFPIRIKAGALADNVPSRDLLVSPDHALFVDDRLVQASALVNHQSIVREHEVDEVFTYYHVELEDHSLILAEGAPAETFVDNVTRMRFDNWAEHEALFGAGSPVPEMALPRAQSCRQVPVATRQRLRQRAEALYPADRHVTAA